MPPDVSIDKSSVTVEFTVLPDGTTENIDVVDSGLPMLLIAWL